MRVSAGVCLCAAMSLLGITVAAQRSGAFGASRDHPAIAYSKSTPADAVTQLNRRLADGSVRLTFEPETGYLKSLLTALDVPVESQVLVYSQTSFQARKISRSNPRAVYFNDHVAVGWVRGGDILEVSAQDPQQGTFYYALPQQPEAAALTRNDNCLACHLSWETLAVPGPVVLTVFPRKSENDYSNGYQIDHRAPLAERWGGWFVTGERVPVRQMGNLPLILPALRDDGPSPVPAKRSLEGEFDTRGYLSTFSDVVALMVLEHQTRATNLITRAGWEYRVALHDAPESISGGTLPPRVREAVDELVDYLLFVDEAPLPAPIRGSSTFAERFSAQGPRDAQGRSLRELQLQTRLMRYPVSYMIYSPGFMGLPDPVKREVLSRLDRILATPGAAAKYQHLTAPLRTQALEILRATTGNRTDP
jgi:hypothetical protein